MGPYLAHSMYYLFMMYYLFIGILRVKRKLDLVFPNCDKRNCKAV